MALCASLPPPVCAPLLCSCISATQNHADHHFQGFGTATRQCPKLHFLPLGVLRALDWGKGDYKKCMLVCHKLCHVHLILALTYDLMCCCLLAVLCSSRTKKWCCRWLPWIQWKPWFYHTIKAGARFHTSLCSSTCWLLLPNLHFLRELKRKHLSIVHDPAICTLQACTADTWICSLVRLHIISWMLFIWYKDVRRAHWSVRTALLISPSI